MRTGLIAAVALAGAATGASAAGKDVCAAGMVCASAPVTVGAALMKAGYQGLISKDGDGDPTIESAANGYKFWIDFYGCENHVGCDSLQFYTSITTDQARTLEFANKWNATHRFMTMSLKDDHHINLRYDVSTAGGLTEANFADVIDCFPTRLGAYDKFVREMDAPAPAKAAPPAPK